jgi:hypothetical protein
LYRGKLPIVKEDAWSKSFVELGIPLITIDNWSAEAMNTQFRSFSREEFKPSDIESLWMPFWEKKIASFLH